MGGFQKATGVNAPHPSRPPRDPVSLAIFVASVVVASLALTRQSLWIDEANAALKAMQPSLASWWQMLVREGGSDLQMPLYMFWLWAWEKIAGHSEFVLRAANIPWLVLAHYSLYRAGRRSALGPRPLLVIASLNPFLWAYMNEARPYVMQYSAACVMGGFLLRAAEDSSFATKARGLWIFGAGLLLLCGSSLLGVIWAAFAGAAWLYLVRDRVRGLVRGANAIPLVISAISLGALGSYYVWTIQAGARASSAASTGLLNVGFVVYELAGAAGLGPGRLDLREHGLAAFREWGVSLLPLVAGFSLCLALLAYGIACAWKARARRAVIAGAISAIPPVLLLFALGYFQNFRILGRHFMPLTPAILGLFFLGLSTMKRRNAVIFGLALTATWLASSLSLRFVERHRKDDYRTAAGIAQTALDQHEIVWWSADNAAAVYYGLPIAHSAESTARAVITPSPAQLSALSAPDLVIASKPDIYDPSGSLGHFLQEHRFTRVRELPAFTIWRKAADPLETR